MSAQPTIATDAVHVGGPYWEQLSVGDTYVEFPAMTLTEGHAALHQSIVGDRLRIALDATLSDTVAGRRLAHPMLVCDVSIGQSTLPTQRVIGNLFYRRLMLRRLPAIGDTLKTMTEIVALKRNTIKEGRKPTGLAVLHIVTTDQEDRAILDYWRCAMLPISDLDASQPHADDLDQFPADLPDDALHATLDGLDLAAYRAAVPGAHFADLAAPTTWVVDGGDSVTAATELARLSLNIAKAHTDPGSHALRQAPRLRRAHDRDRRGAAHEGTPEPRDDHRLASLQPPRPGLRGRRAAQHRASRGNRGAARRRRPRDAAHRGHGAACTTAHTRRSSTGDS